MSEFPSPSFPLPYYFPSLWPILSFPLSLSLSSPSFLVLSYYIFAFRNMSEFPSPSFPLPYYFPSLWPILSFPLSLSLSSPSFLVLSYYIFAPPLFMVKSRCLVGFWENECIEERSINVAAAAGAAGEGAPRAGKRRAGALSFIIHHKRTKTHENARVRSCAFTIPAGGAVLRYKKIPPLCRGGIFDVWCFFRGFQA